MGVGCGMALAKPRRRSVKLRNRSKIKELLDLQAAQPIVIQALRAASEHAVYASSAFHRPTGSKMGVPAKRRYPHASKCDPKWDQRSATQALRDAIRQGQVSQAWDQRYPRYAWHLEDGVLYEARLSNAVSGEYHAYPLEDRMQWPVALRSRT